MECHKLVLALTLVLLMSKISISRSKVDSTITIKDYWSSSTIKDSLNITFSGSGWHDIKELTIKMIAGDSIIYERNVTSCSMIDEYVSEDQAITDSIIAHYSNLFKQSLKSSINEIEKSEKVKGLKKFADCFCSIPGCKVYLWSKINQKFDLIWQP